MKFIACLSSFLFLLTALHGQTDTLYIETVEVKAKKIREYAIGSQVSTWGQAEINQSGVSNVADLLAAESTIFIKSYGLNSLATSSIRGGNAGQTLVLWNGFPIQSPMLGLLDLSLLPSNISEEVSLQKGGNASLWGSGAVAGLIALNNRPNENPPSFEIATTIGAFGTWQQDLKLKLGSIKFQSVTKFSHQQADNDFDYFQAPGLPDRTQTNAQINQQNFLQDFYWFYTKNQRLALHFWRQESWRQIPPTNVQNRSEAYQEDEASRIILDWKYWDAKYVINSKVGYFHEHLDYYDPQIIFASPSQFTTLLLETDAQWIISPQNKLSLGINYSTTKAQVNGYAEAAREYRPSIFANYLFEKNNLQLQASLRQTIINQKVGPLAPVIALDYQLHSLLKMQFKVSRDFRFPTLNDRFWQPGGNPDLKAERGWSQEIALHSHLVKSNHQFNWSFSIFNRNINDWILWSIREGQSFWSANNITKVWSRGLEPRVAYSFQKNHLKIRLKLGYDYIRSTNQIALQNPKIAAGAQLIYTPKHQAFTQIHLQYDKLGLQYRHHYTSSSTGLNEDVEAYQTGFLRLQYQGKLGKHPWETFVQIHNIWDVDYFVINRRPMPGRYVKAGLRFNLILKKTKETI